MKYKFVANNPDASLLNFRADHSTASADVGDLLNGQEAQGDETWPGPNGEIWLLAITARGLALPVPAWVAVFWNGKSRGTLTENPITPPTGGRVVTVSIVDGALSGSGDIELK